MLTKNKSQAELKTSLAVCIDLLPAVSRTFAISILHLKGQLKTAVIASYLLCRIADTIEDDPSAPLEKRSELFDLFDDCLDDDEAISKFVFESDATLSGDDAHLNLVANTRHVINLYRSLETPAQEAIKRWVREMSKGMKDFIARYPDGIHVQTIDEFRQYCYYVAGTVGHLLTKLWHHYSSQVDDAVYRLLDPLSEAFGEGLQTVNILKDVATDIEQENAVFLPEVNLKENGSSHREILAPDQLKNNRVVIDDMIEMARKDLDKAFEYYFTLPRYDFSIKRFCILPLMFGIATLRELGNSDSMLKTGGCVKITRKEVKWLVLVSPVIIFSNTLVRLLADRIRHKPLTFGLSK